MHPMKQAKTKYEQPRLFDLQQTVNWAAGEGLPCDGSGHSAESFCALPGYTARYNCYDSGLSAGTNCLGYGYSALVGGLSAPEEEI
jgi:hypothetical protein